MTLLTTDMQVLQHVLQSKATWLPTAERALFRCAVESYSSSSSSLLVPLGNYQAYGDDKVLVLLHLLPLPLKLGDHIGNATALARATASCAADTWVWAELR